MRGGAAPVLAWALAACAAIPGSSPPPFWTATSPDLAVAVEVWGREGQVCVVVSGREEGCFEGVGLQGMTFSERGAALAYPVRRGAGWAMAWNGEVGPSWEGVGRPLLSPDGRRLAYPAADENGWRVVADGEPGPTFDELLAGSMLFDDRGVRLAYAGHRGDSVHVVVDGASGRGWDGVGRLTFGPGGDRVAFVGRRGGRVAVVVDGDVGPPHDEIGELTLTSGDLAYASRQGTAWHVAHGTRRYGPFEAVRGLAFAPDGALWFVGVAGGREAVLQDGQPHAWHAAVTTPVFSASGRVWGYIGRDSASSVVFLSGDDAVTEEWADDLAVSADGRRYAFVAAGPAGQAVVDEAARYPFEMVIERTLQFSACGYWTALIGLPARRELRVYVDGAETDRRLDWSDLVALAQQADPAAALRRWVAAAASQWRGDGACMP
jgi:hypothetical protein